MVDEITQTESEQRGLTTKIPVPNKSVSISDGYTPEKNPIKHVQRQSTLQQSNNGRIQGHSYTIPFAQTKNESLPKNTPKSFYPSVRSHRTVSPTKSLRSPTPTGTKQTSRKEPRKTQEGFIQKEIGPNSSISSLVSKPLPINGVYGIVNSFLHGPVLDCLELASIDFDQSILASLDGASSFLNLFE
jgi:hypothetical protein